MMKGKKISISELTGLTAILIYLILNITSTVLDLPINASVNQRIAITFIILLCNVLIYILLKNRIMNKILLFYWIFSLVMSLGSIGRLVFPYSPLFVIYKEIYPYCMYFISANTLFYFPGFITYNGLSINSGTLFLNITAILFIILYLVKIIRQK